MMGNRYFVVEVFSDVPSIGLYCVHPIPLQLVGREEGFRVGTFGRPEILRLVVLHTN